MPKRQIDSLKGVKHAVVKGEAKVLKGALHRKIRALVKVKKCVVDVDKYCFFHIS